MKVLSINVCLGLKNKIDLARTWTKNNEYDILFIQEAEVTDEQLSLNIDGYKIHLSDNQGKKRMVVYVKNELKVKIYVAKDLELILVESDEAQCFGIYRTFKLSKEDTQISYSSRMIEWIKSKINPKKQVVICGDFNFDYKRRNESGYNNYKIAQLWLSLTDEFQLEQIISEITWQRTVNNAIRESCLDHIYTNVQVFKSGTVDLNVGDHLGVFIKINNSTPKPPKPKPIKRIVRNWSNYSREKICEQMDVPLTRFESMTIDQHDEFLTQGILNALNNIAPERLQTYKTTRQMTEPERVSRLRNRKRNLLKKSRKNNDANGLRRARDVDRKIRSEVDKHARNEARRLLKNNNQSAFWRAVNKAKKTENPRIPETLFNENKEATTEFDKAEMFAEFFQTKVKTDTIINENVYNGKRFIFSDVVRVFTEKRLDEAIKASKPKGSFGFDRVPMRVLIDVYPVIRPVLISLFDKIEHQKTIPRSWKIARIIPLHKKGETNQVPNYRPISNLGSIAKIFERMILATLIDLAYENNVDLTGKSQYGFKKGVSTATLALALQERIASYLDKNQKAGVASLDLTAAFDLVDHELLFKRLEIYGFPKKIIDLIKQWLGERFAFIELGLTTSSFFKINKGTIQGSVLGPVLFALYIRPLLDIIPMFSFADDGYVTRGGENWKDELQKDISLAYDWLTSSGMKINAEKTEFVIFGDKDRFQQETLEINKVKVESKREMKVLGLVFDSRLKWTTQIEKAIKNSRISGHGLRYLSRYFTNDELVTVVKSQVYSSIYYNCEVWLIPSLNKKLKKRLRSAITGCLKSAFGLWSWPLNSSDIHEICGIATLEQWANYAHARTLYKIIRAEKPEEIYKGLLEQSLVERRANITYFHPSNKKVIGINKFQNRVKFVSSKIKNTGWDLDEANFKKLNKILFLK